MSKLTSIKVARDYQSVLLHPLHSTIGLKLILLSNSTPPSASYYQSLIGILHWIVELGRIDITTEVSMMASYMSLPCQGHQDQLFHIFAFLKNKHNAEMVFDPSEPDIDKNLFPKEDWSNTVYGECSEDIPSNISEARGFGFKM